MWGVSIDRARADRNRRIVIAGILAVAAVALGIGAADIADANSQPLTFATPSGNISCQLTPPVADIASSVRCDIATFTYNPPPAPTGCQVIFGHTMMLKQGVPAQFGCAHDTMVLSHVPVVAYGDSARVGVLRCDVTDKGVACTDDSTPHFFRLARESYDLA